MERSETQNSGITDLSKLDKYRQMPRSDSSEFFMEIAGEAPLLGRGRWRNKYANAPMLYSAVVQANPDLWKPGDSLILPIVLVLTADPKYSFDTEWLTSAAEKIRKMKKEVKETKKLEVPKDCQKLMTALKDDYSRFCLPLGKSLAGDVDAWCVTFTIEDQKELPCQRLPGDGIVPLLLLNHLQKVTTIGFWPKASTLTSAALKIKTCLRLIPGRYYEA